MGSPRGWAELVAGADARGTDPPHQPASRLFDAIKLAGIDPTATGYAVDPERV